MRNSAARLGFVLMLVVAGASSVSVAHAADALSCGQTVTTSVVLAADIGPCLGDGLVVTASGVTVDLGGHAVRGGGRGNQAATPDQVGIRLAGVSNVTVANGTVRDFYTGVLVRGGSGNTITRLTVADNNAGTGATENGNGIYLDGSSGNEVTGNTVTGNGPYAGIGVDNGSEHNHIAYNQVTDNNLVTTGGTVTPFQQDDGIGFGSGASFNTVDHNAVYRNGDNGVNLAGGDHNQLIANDIRDNGKNGVNAGGSGHLVTDNVIDHNGYEQFIAPGRPPSPGSYGGVVTCGTCFGPGDLNTIERNVVTRNNGPGISLLFNGVQFVGRAYGALTPRAYNAPRSNLVQNNVVQDNLGDGIFVQCDFLRQVNFQASCLPNPPPHQGARILYNRTAGNGGPGAGTTAWDLHDGNVGCDSNIWMANSYQTANPPCTTNPGPGGGPGTTTTTSQPTTTTTTRPTTTTTRPTTTTTQPTTTTTTPSSVSPVCASLAQQLQMTTDPATRQVLQSALVSFGCPA